MFVFDALALSDLQWRIRFERHLRRGLGGFNQAHFGQPRVILPTDVDHPAGRQVPLLLIFKTHRAAAVNGKLKLAVGVTFGAGKLRVLSDTNANAGQRLSIARVDDPRTIAAHCSSMALRFRVRHLCSR